MGALRFDEGTHTYTLIGGHGGEIILPSVSQILQKSGMYGYPKTASSREKMSRGTFVHSLTEMVDSKSITSKDVDEDVAGYVVAYEKFIEDAKLEVLSAEIPICHDTLLYGAKPDRIGILHQVSDDICVVDIKTGIPHPANMLQLSAYHEAVNHPVVNDGAVLPAVTKSYAVYLGQDGSYKVRENKEHSKNFSLFLSCLQLLRWKDAHGIGKQGDRGTF